MLKLIVLAVVGYIFYRALKSWMIGSGPQSEQVDGRGLREVDDVLVQDPICKTYVAQRDSIHVRHQGELVHFCSEACRDRFLQDRSGNNP